MRSGAPAATILIRLIVGGILAAEGLQKFLDPDALGAGRFARIGIPAPHFLAPFVGAVEMASGALLVAGLLTRLACVPVLISMTVALLSTKIPVLLGRGFAGFALQKLPTYGVWSFLHEARTDLLMLFGLAFLCFVGAGPISVDARIEAAISTEERRARQPDARHELS